jgi:hypothetical protein
LPLLITLSSGLSSLLLNHWLLHNRKYASWPAYTAPLVMLAWLLLALSDSLQLSENPVIFSRLQTNVVLDLPLAVLLGLSQVLLVNDAFSGTLILLGLLANRRTALWAVAGSSLGLLLASLLGQASEASQSFYGFNGVLLAIALSQQSRSAGLIFSAILLATLLQFSASSWGLSHVLSAAFVLSCWLLQSRLGQRPRRRRAVPANEVAWTTARQQWNNAQNRCMLMYPRSLFRPTRMTTMLRLTTLLTGLALSANCLAFSLADLSQQDASTGLKDTLSQGAKVAIAQLGKPGGFSANPKMRIELPGNLGKAASAMKMMGMGAQVEQLEASMNKAAEAAVPQAQVLLLEAVKKMTVQDAKSILTGTDDAATSYLNKTSRAQLRAKFLPIVQQATNQVGLAKQYNSFAGQAASFGAIDTKNANIESYVTEEALDGLFKVIAEQEASVRQNPAAAATSLAKKVFSLQ